MLAIFIHVSKKRISYVRLEDTAQVAHVEDVVETSAKKNVSKPGGYLSSNNLIHDPYNRRLGIPAQGCGKQLALHNDPKPQTPGLENWTRTTGENP